jgi:hypothetical protein
MNGTASDLQRVDRARLVRREALRFWGPIALLFVGGVGVLTGFLLGEVCTRFVVDRLGQVSCVPLLDEAVGGALVGGSGIALAAGVYLVFFNRRERFVHTCAECGKTYRDDSRESAYRARGKMVCSFACAERIEERARLEELRSKVAALETLAVQAAQGVERTRARERLAEIAAYATEPVKSQAREALRRIEGS